MNKIVKTIVNIAFNIECWFEYNLVEIVLSLILIVFPLVLIVVGARSCINEDEKYKNNVEEVKTMMYNEIGHKIILNKDTLVVTDYDFCNRTYSLSNGATIDCGYYYQLKEKEKK